MGCDQQFMINEIFYSIQGESTLVGIPTVFIRLTGCNLRCSYCDTTYAFEAGKLMTLDDILVEVNKYPGKNICITGGEPLLHENINILIQGLLDHNKEISIETNGTQAVNDILRPVKLVFDMKMPSSGMVIHNRFDQFQYLLPGDELKFVCGDEEDIDYAFEMIQKYALYQRADLLFSPIFNGDHTFTRLMVERVIYSNIPNIRVQLQIHKVIWPSDQQGV